MEENNKNKRNIGVLLTNIKGNYKEDIINKLFKVRKRQLVIMKNSLDMDKIGTFLNILESTYIDIKRNKILNFESVSNQMIFENYQPVPPEQYKANWKGYIYFHDDGKKSLEIWDRAEDDDFGMDIFGIAEYDILGYFKQMEQEKERWFNINIDVTVHTQYDAYSGEMDVEQFYKIDVLDDDNKTIRENVSII